MVTFRLWVIFWALLVLFVTKMNCLTVLSPSSIAGRFVSSPVCSKFFGPQSNYERNGTALLYTGDLCKTVATNFTGKIMVYSIADTGACSFKTRYLNIWKSGAIAAVEYSTFPVPGQTYAMHDGDWGKQTKHKSVPWLQVYSEDFKPISNFMKNTTEAVEFHIGVDTNQWAVLYSSWDFILVIRAILPALFLPTAVYGAYVLHEVLKGENNAMRPTKIVVLSIETSSMILNGLFLAVNGMYSDSNMPFQSIWFFGTGFFGWSMFTTITVAVFYYSLNKATSTFTLVRNSLSTHRVLLFLVFVLCVAMDLIIGSMFATYQKATATLAVGAIIFTIGNFIAALFFFYEKNKFHRHLVLENSKWDSKNRPPLMVQMSQHMGRWLYISAIFMLMFCIITPMIGFNFAWSINGNFALIPLLFFIRWGTGFTQIKALGWNPRKEEGGGKKHITRWGGDTTGASYSNSTSQSNNNTSSEYSSFLSSAWMRFAGKVKRGGGNRDDDRSNNRAVEIGTRNAHVDGSGNTALINTNTDVSTSASMAASPSGHV